MSTRTVRTRTVHTRTEAAERTAAGVKLHIDWTACDGRGLCMELLPEFLGRDDWGFPIVAEPGAALPLEVLDAAKEAVAACPKRALKLMPR